jgi:hypothetical protein
MAPAFLVEFDTRPGRRPRGIIQVAWITAHARHSGGTTAAGVAAIPRLVRVVFAHPTAIVTGGAGRHQRPPGHHIVGGLNVEIFVDLSATRWLRLNGRPLCREQSLQRMYRSSSWIGVVFGRRTILSATVWWVSQPRHLNFEIGTAAVEGVTEGRRGLRRALES